MSVSIVCHRRRRGVLFAGRIGRRATQKYLAGQNKSFLLAAYSNDSGRLRTVCRSKRKSAELKEKVEMKRSPMAVLISLSREGLICSLTRALRRDKMYLAQKAHQKDEGGSG